MSVCFLFFKDSFGLLVHPVNVSVVSGALHLPCVGYSYVKEDNVHISWKKGNEAINTKGMSMFSSYERRGEIFLRVSYLSIDCIGLEHEGNYTCEASSGNKTLQANFQISLNSECTWSVKALYYICNVSYFLSCRTGHASEIAILGAMEHIL